jgi:hypothetical protein
MAVKDPFKAFTAGFKRQQLVNEPIASETWTFKGPKGRRQTARIQVGRPQQVPDDKNADWFCPVFIERWTPHVVPAMGVSPVDSLMNAMGLVRSFREHIAELHISRAASRPAIRRKT